MLGETPAPRLDKALATAVPEAASLSRSRIRALIKDGAVRDETGKAVRDPAARTAPRAVWLISVAPGVEAETTAENIPLSVIYEDDDLIVVDKSAGMVVHPAPGSPGGTLVNALLHHCAGSLSGIGGVKRPGIVHRIDKDTSGLLVVAKNDAAHHGLAAQFADHSLARKYTALTWGAPSAADPRLRGIEGVSFKADGVIRIEGKIARHRTDRKRMAVAAAAGRHAVTMIRVVEKFGPETRPVAALVSCRLETGRTHQIRVHLSHVGHGLVGDQTYGKPRAVAKGALSAEKSEILRNFPRQALHAAVLGFKHPLTNQMLQFEAGLPKDFTQLLAILRQD